MKIRRFPAATFAAATIALGVGFSTPVASQEASTPVAPLGAPVIAAEKVSLSGAAEDVLKLTHAKVHDDVTVAFIQNGNGPYFLTASEIVFLRQQGVSERVLTAMLSQPPAPANAPQPVSAAPAEEQFASAPQYITQPGSTTYVETVPASTVYLATTPIYYSFYDPWPTWSCWYPYPWFSFGFSWGWGSCNYGYWNSGYCNNGYWNNYNNCYYGSYATGPYGSNPPNGNPPPPGGSVASNNRSETRTSGGRPSAGLNSSGVNDQLASSSGVNRGEGRPVRADQSARLTSTWNNNSAQSATTRPSASQASRTVNSQTGRQVSGGDGSVNNRTATGRPADTRSTAQPVRSAYSATPTSVWNNNARQETASRSTYSRGAAPTARPSTTSAGATTAWSRPSSQSANRYATSPSASYSRSSVSPSSGYSSSRSSPSFSRPSTPSFSRPSASPSFRSMGSSSSRGGGSFGGAGASRVSSGGGSRGGGGGRSR